MGTIYLVSLKTAVTEATKAAFGPGSVDFPNLHVSIDYPVDAQAYPGLWIDFDPTGAFQSAGIGHQENTLNGGIYSRALRYRFSGAASFTCVAFSSLERDRLFDAVIRVLAFSESETESPFRQAIENNDFVAISMNYDQIEQRGNAAQQGTPWGTDDVIYEATVAIDLIGEVVVTASGTLLPLSDVNLFSWVETLEVDTQTGGHWIG